MKFTGVTLQILDKIRMQSISLQGATRPLIFHGFSQEDYNFLHSRNVILSGDFISVSKNFKNILREQEVNVQREITPDTEILICGQYPDWVLVEEARHYGIRIMFADKTGESFSRIATKLIKNKTSLTVGELLDV